MRRTYAAMAALAVFAGCGAATDETTAPVAPVRAEDVLPFAEAAPATTPTTDAPPPASAAPVVTAPPTTRATAPPTTRAPATSQAPVTATPADVAPPPAASADISYANCTAARAAGAAPVHRGDPGYASHLDRDNDGAGCE